VSNRKGEVGAGGEWGCGMGRVERWGWGGEWVKYVSEESGVKGAE